MIRSIGVFLVVTLVAVIVLLAAEQGSRSDSFKAKVVSVSRQPGIAPRQMVCATGNGRGVCTAVAPSEPGAPFRAGDCVSIANEGIASSALKPRSCD